MVALGSALGALARFGLGQWLLRQDFRRPVVATLAVNLGGCLAAGALAAGFSPADRLAAALILSGFLGSYTTVSSFSLETLGMWRAGDRGMAAAYVLCSLAGCVGLAWAGFEMTGWLGA